MNLKAVITLVLTAVVLSMVVLQWAPNHDREPLSFPGSANTDIDDLKQHIARLERQQVATLQRLSELEQFFVSSKLGLVPPMGAELESAAPARADTREAAPQPRPRPGQRNVEQIEAAGLTVEEFEAIEAFADEVQFSGFEEDWSQRRQRYLQSDRTASAAERLREDLGDDAYDRYLFASGRSNRVRVRQVMKGSAAEQAGLSNGDIVISYADERVFNFEDLRRLSYQGELGESVILEKRDADGNVSQLIMPRGPMGLSGYGGWREAPDS